ncbi:MAG: hypothetical protein J6A17_03830 [Bacilli bacterium]|nr:hypothetical protein [Bacilli bacterium]
MKEKTLLAFITGVAIGLIIGSLTVYFVMKDSNEKEINAYKEENLSITEKFTIEIEKLNLKTSAYHFVDTIENHIQTKLSEDNKFEVKAGMYLIKDTNTLKEVDEETLNIITNGKVISDIDFNGNLPDDNSMVILTEKGKIKEAVFYKDGYQIKYDIIKTEVTKIEK